MSGSSADSPALCFAPLDLHSHVLPGIDDGCRDLNDSLDCIRQFIAAGYRGTVCTPHILPDQFPEITPANVQRWVETLRQELAAAGLEYQLWTGGEVRLAKRTLQWFARDGVPTLGDSRVVLLDWWGYDWPSYIDQIFDWLQAEGYQPLLAHPERMDLPFPQLEEVLTTLQERGVWLQGNLNSLSGGEGRQAQMWSQGWLKAGRYRWLASDMHRPNQLTGRFAGLKVARELVGDETAHRLLCAHPAQVLQWEGDG